LSAVLAERLDRKGSSCATEQTSREATEQTGPGGVGRPVRGTSGLCPPGPGTSRLCPVDETEPASLTLLLVLGEGCCDAITLPATPKRLWQENELMWDRLSSRSLNSPRQKSNIVWTDSQVS
jgi:hypothetical protein